ncbi:MAG: cupin-like domain-containing protein [Alphaproteobacteria bacterium]
MADLAHHATGPDAGAGPLAEPLAGSIEVDPVRREAGLAGGEPFRFRHTLHAHRALQLPALADLAGRLDGDRVEFNAGALQPNQDPDATPGIDLDPAEIVARIEDCGAWLVLKNVESEPAYRALLTGTLDQVARDRGFADHRDAGMDDVQGFIFVASAGSVTPFHVDYEENLFFHLKGPKIFHLFDNCDRSFVSEAELESFPGKHRNLPYQEQFFSDGVHHVLKPGTGLYVPHTWPHFVETGDGVAVSIAVTWKTVRVRRDNALYFMNAVLRRMGRAQARPGASPAMDGLKVMVWQVSRALLQPLRRTETARRFLRGLIFGRRANYFYRRKISG